MPRGDGMKGVIELNWKIVLIIIAGLVAFIIIFLFTAGLSDELIDLVTNFNVTDLLNIWKKITPGDESESSS